MTSPGVAAEEGGDGVSAEVDDWIAESERQKDELRVLVDAHSDAELHWRPGPDRWSIAEHIRHLVLTNAEYVEALEAALGKAAAEGRTGPPPYDSSFLGSRFVRSLEPPVERRFRTFKRLVPSSAPGAPAELLDAFDAAMDRYEQVLRRHAAVDMGGVRMRSPFLRFLRMTLAEAARAVLAHNRRHLWLADEVVRSPGFAAPAG